MTGRRFTEDQRQARRAETARLYLQGRYQHEIAAELEVSRQQVGYDLAVIRRAWRMSQIRDFDAAKEKELAKIDQLEREYWDAWHRSQQNKETELTESVTGERISEKERKTIEGQVGNASFLVGVQWCITKRCEILGFNAPTKIAPTTPDGAEPYEAKTFDDIVKIIRATRELPRGEQPRCESTGEE